MGLIEKMESVDRRVIWWILVAVIAYAYIRPMGLPIMVSESTLLSYNALDELKAGDKVILTIIGPGILDEQGPTYTMVIRWLLEKGVKIVFVATFGPEQAPIIEFYAKETNMRRDYVYGSDFVNLGFIPGWETMVAGLGSDFQDIAKVDAYGTPTSELELTKDINDASSFAAWVGVTGLFPIRHWNAPYGTTLITMCSAADAPGFTTYAEAGQLTGLIVGKTGGAEMEFLLGKPGKNIRDMDAVTLGLGLTIFFVVLGNISLVVKKLQGGT
jgi:hypothetical protein